MWLWHTRCRYNFVGGRRTRDDGDLATFGQSQPGLGLCFSKRRRLGWRNSLGRLRHDGAEAETIDLVMGVTGSAEEEVALKDERRRP